MQDFYNAASLVIDIALTIAFIYLGIALIRAHRLGPKLPSSSIWRADGSKPIGTSNANADRKGPMPTGTDSAGASPK